MKKLILGIVLFLIGAIGVLSLLTMEIPLPPEAEAILADRFSPQQIKLLTLINPTLFILIAVIVGTLTYQGAKLRVPIVERVVGLRSEAVNYKDILKYGVLGGLIAGFLIVGISAIFTPFLPQSFIEFGEDLQPGVAVRFLYGGFTEEIMMRFGLMTFIVWLASRISDSHKAWVYWLGIGFAAIVFALGHLPIAFQAVEEPSASLFAYIILGNVIGGLIFGWLYWKKGLEAAFIAHIFAHVAMVVLEPLLG